MNKIFTQPALTRPGAIPKLYPPLEKEILIHARANVFWPPCVAPKSKL